MPSRLGSEIEDVRRDVMLLEQAQHAVAHVRRIVVRDHRLARALRQRHFAARGQRMRRVHEHHELVLAEHHRAEPRLGRLERQHAEVERALRDLGADLPRRHAPDVHVHQRVRLRGSARSSAARRGPRLRWRRSARGRGAGRAGP